MSRIDRFALITSRMLRRAKRSSVKLAAVDPASSPLRYLPLCLPFPRGTADVDCSGTHEAASSLGRSRPAGRGVGSTYQQVPICSHKTDADGTILVVQQNQVLSCAMSNGTRKSVPTSRVSAAPIRHDAPIGLLHSHHVPYHHLRATRCHRVVGTICGPGERDLGAHAAPMW